MPEQLTRSEYDYILSCLKYTRYAHENTPYPNAEIKRQQLVHLDYIEEKLRTLRDTTTQRKPSNDDSEFF
jgi:hypothetical protein